MNTEFNEITENYQDETYIYVSTDEIQLEILPFYSLPARKIANIYNKKNDQYTFLKGVYNLIHIAMKNPQDFKKEVYDRGVSYSGLIEFLNTWIYESSDYKNNPTKERIDNSRVVLDIIHNKLAKGEDIKNTLLIRYFIEHIKEAAVEHNKHCKPDDVILEVNIAIPIGDNYEND